MVGPFNRSQVIVFVVDWPTHKIMCMKIQELWEKQDADEAAAAEA